MKARVREKRHGLPGAGRALGSEGGPVEAPPMDR
jgi:hypothetical protein